MKLACEWTSWVMRKYLMGIFDRSCVWHSFPSYHTNLFSPFLSSFHGKIHYCFRAAGVKPCGFTNGLAVWLVSAVVAGYRILICFFSLVLVFWGFVSQPQSMLKQLCCCVHSWMPSQHVGNCDFCRIQAS